MKDLIDSVTKNNRVNHINWAKRLIARGGCVQGCAQASPGRSGARQMLTRDDLIKHILWMKTKDPRYASWAAEFYRDLLPDFKLGQGLREAMQKQTENKNG